MERARFEIVVSVIDVEDRSRWCRLGSRLMKVDWESSRVVAWRIRWVKVWDNGDCGDVSRDRMGWVRRHFEMLRILFCAAY